MARTRTRGAVAPWKPERLAQALLEDLAAEGGALATDVGVAGPLASRCACRGVGTEDQPAYFGSSFAAEAAAGSSGLPRHRLDGRTGGREPGRKDAIDGIDAAPADEHTGAGDDRLCGPLVPAAEGAPPWLFTGFLA